AISARRRRRISSSLLPLNMGPQTTSIQPILPFVRFITRHSPLFKNLFLYIARKSHQPEPPQHREIDSDQQNSDRQTILVSPTLGNLPSDETVGRIRSHEEIHPEDQLRSRITLFLHAQSACAIDSGANFAARWRFTSSKSRKTSVAQPNIQPLTCSTGTALTRNT